MSDNLASLEGTLGLPEGAMWDCTGAVQLTYDLGGTAIAHEATTPERQLFARMIWGTCDDGQLIPGGLRDGKVCTHTPPAPIRSAGLECA